MAFKCTSAHGFVAERQCQILPRCCDKNQLHEALANENFEDASRLIASQNEAYLVECIESKNGCYKSSLHLIAAMCDTEEATRFCRQLLQKINNALNREYLLNMTTVDEFEMGTWTAHARVAAIHIAAYNGNSGVVRLLCQEYGVDVNCSTSETLEETHKTGISPLEWAARKGHAEVVKVLVDSKAHVNITRTSNSITPLYIAAQNGHTETVKLLLDYKADVNACCTDTGATPLYAAAYRGHTETVKLLLENKADVNACRTDTGATPLYTAAYIGHTEIVKLLQIGRASCRERV